MSRRLLLGVFGLLMGLALVGCGGDKGTNGRIRVAYVTNGPASFWTIAEAGAKAGAKAFDVDCDVFVPQTGSVEEQQRIVEELLVKRMDGIAISPIDAANQIDLINGACARTHVITHDSDAPATKRLCYVGMDNYRAGRQCGQLVKEALPEGGKIMIFVGRLEQDNARKRRQGVIDEVLGRSSDATRFDPPGSPLSAGPYTILDTRTDQFDEARAKSNAEDSMTVHADLACMVGLFAYNPPACLEAVKGAGKLGRIKIVAFDEADQTLQGILDGNIHGTVCQQPYKYGYESVRILAALARGDRSVLPEGGFLDISATMVRRENARAFWDELQATLAGAKK